MTFQYCLELDVVVAHALHDVQLITPVEIVPIRIVNKKYWLIINTFFKCNFT